MRELAIKQTITEREYKSLDKYFNEINKIALIPLEEEVMLARRIKEGDHHALERLTKGNLRFVVSVAKQYQNQGLTLGDLINEGNMGLIIAAKRFDETKGFKFISYAVWWIRQSIIAALADHARVVRLPYNQLGLLTRLYKAFSTLEQDHGRRPSIEELAEHLEISTEKVSDLIDKSCKSVSLDQPLTEEEGYSLLDVLEHDGPSPSSEVMSESIAQEIQRSLKMLKKRDREIICLFFGLDGLPKLSLEEIGERFEITKEHVGRLKEKALDQLRNGWYATALRSCLSV
ncbi:MAG: sigma-70 family RNA polymerase sigma factor [Mucilaginibacter sp.]|nr:sigma-70 family RNA polymerase sigma factor [Mucilaginibacter sp.]